MANESAFYVEIDGVWHEMSGDVTVCGLTGPYLVMVQTRDVPDEVHCGANATETTEIPTPPKTATRRKKK